MKFNEKIRKFRKNLNLTQEQVGAALGVTPPAVNKWESGASYPDITLLAPLARLLQTDIDTPLSFREELTDQEVNTYMAEVIDKLQRVDFETGYVRAKELISSYPGCDKLILVLAQALNMYLELGNITNYEKKEEQIAAWLEMVATGDDPQLVSMATVSICSNYMKKKEYEKAQQLLDQIPPLGYDKRPMQSSLYIGAGKKEEALSLLESSLYQSVNQVLSNLLQIMNIYCREQDYNKAWQYAELAEKTSEIYELGDYQAASPGMLVAVSQKDVGKSLDYIERMVGAIDEIGNYEAAELYQHIPRREKNDQPTLRYMMKKGIIEDEDLGFLRDEPRFQKLVREMKRDMDQG